MGERDGLLREEKLELKLLGLGAIQHKWGSIRIIVDDGWGGGGVKRLAGAKKWGLGLHTLNELLRALKHKHTS